MKYDRHPDLGRVAGGWLAESWRACTPLPSNRYQVIPIPLHRQRLQERGFNQAEAIAKSFCHFTGYSLRAEGLLRVRATDALFGLSPAERQQIMRSAFQVGKSLDLGRSILLLDDIYTTGTTVQEAAKVLREKGYTVAGAIALSSSKTS
jgi:ComF family protein